MVSVMESGGDQVVAHVGLHALGRSTIVWVGPSLSTTILLGIALYPADYVGLTL